MATSATYTIFGTSALQIAQAAGAVAWDNVLDAGGDVDGSAASVSLADQSSSTLIAYGFNLPLYVPRGASVRSVAPQVTARTDDGSPDLAWTTALFLVENGVAVQVSGHGAIEAGLTGADWLPIDQTAAPLLVTAWAVSVNTKHFFRGYTLGVGVIAVEGGADVSYVDAIGATIIVDGPFSDGYLEGAFRSALAERGRKLVLLIGDSRNTFGDNRGIGEIFRGWGVRYCSLFCPALTDNQGSEDGLGMFMPALLSVSREAPGPGDTPTGPGFANHYPVAMASRFVTPANPALWQALFGMVYSTAGFDMALDATHDSGGNFALGDPANGKVITRIRRVAVANNVAQWLKTDHSLCYDGSFTPVVTGTYAPPTGSSASPEITVQTTAGNGTSGTNIRLSSNHQISEAGDGYLNKGHCWLGEVIDFNEPDGVVVVCFAQGGWTNRSHLSTTVYAANDNPYTDFTSPNGAKYSDACAQEFLSKVFVLAPDPITTILIVNETGINSAVGGAFTEWNGITIGAYKENTRQVMLRAIANARAAGFTTIKCALRSIWQSGSNFDMKTTLINAARRELCVENAWTYIDNVGHLMDDGSTDGQGLKAVYHGAGDAVHQSLDGIIKKGAVEWAAITAARLPAYDDPRYMRVNR